MVPYIPLQEVLHLKKFVVLAILLALSGCARLPVVPEPEDVPVEPVVPEPESLTIQTEKYTYTGTLAHENGTVTWKLTEPQDLVGLTFVCTDTSCTLVVEDVVIPLDIGTAEVVRRALTTQE